MTRRAAPHGIHPPGTTAPRQLDPHTALVQSAHPLQVTSDGTATPILTQPVANEPAPVGAGDVFGATLEVEFQVAHVAEGMDRFAALLRAVARAADAASTSKGSGGTATVTERASLGSWP